MDKSGTKLLKILLFVGVFGYLQYYDINRGAHSINSITAGLVMAAAVYLIASLFGIVLSLTSNYFIAIIGTGALALFLAFKLDEIIAGSSWLTEGVSIAILSVLVALCLILDIRTVKRSLATPKTTTGGVAPMTGTAIEPDSANEKMRRGTKANSQSVLNISNMLEKQWGRKPSYEEVMDYIDGLAIPNEK